jgi:predicted HicB family RNase H-like nuclease
MQNDEIVKVTSLRLSDELHARAVAAAAADRRSLANWLTLVVERAVTDAEAESRRQSGEPER